MGLKSGYLLNYLEDVDINKIIPWLREHVCRSEEDINDYLITFAIDLGFIKPHLDGGKREPYGDYTLRGIRALSDLMRLLSDKVTNQLVDGHYEKVAFIIVGDGRIVPVKAVTQGMRR